MNPVRILTIFAFCFSLVNESRSQAINSNFSYYNFDNGLSSNEIRGMAQDENGFLWIGTANGLNRYDGNSFKQYFKSAGGLSENTINDIVLLHNGMLAIATLNGLDFFDTRSNMFSSFRSGDTSALAAYSNNFLKLCTDRKGNLYTYTQTDIYVFDSALKLLKTFHSGLSSKDINRSQISFANNIGLLPDGNVLILFRDHYSLYDPSTAQLRVLNNSTPSPWSFVARQDFSNIYLTNAYGRFWFFRIGKDSIYSYDFKGNKFSSYALFQKAHDYFGVGNSIYGIDSSHILFLLPYSGFYELSIDDHYVSSLKELPAEPSPACVAVNQHNISANGEHIFWVGTTKGLYESSPFKNQFTTIMIDSATKEFDNNFISILNNQLWIASYGNGFYRYDSSANHFIHYYLSFHDGDLTPLTWSIRYHSLDTLWIGTQNGLIWFAEKTKKFGRLPFAHPLALDSFPITTQFEDSHGLIWMGVGNGHGVAYYDPGKNSFTVYNEKTEPEFPLRYPIAIAEDENGNLWMGTQKGGGLVEWNRNLNRFTLFSAKQSSAFTDDRINDIYADHQGQLWIATQLSGLICYNLATGKFESFGTEQGLSQETVYRIRAAQYPYLWITTDFGLNRFNIQTKTFETFYEKDGLPTNEFSEGIFYDAESGIMYVGFRKGFVKFNARNFRENTSTPDVLITDLQVNDQPLQYTGNLLQLNYKENNLTVNFTAVDLVNGTDLKFRYRLGNELHWNELEKNRQIQFSNLSPGNYSLRIEAANKSGIWSNHEAILNFYIQSPFWRTAWFFFLIAVIAGSVIFALYRFRIRQLQKVQDMRNRIAQDLHDDIGGTMTAMNLTNELALQHLDNPPVARKLLVSISEDLKNVGETLDDIVWTVNPKNDSMEEVMARMRRFASGAWEAAGIDFNFDFETNAENIRLNMEQRHDLYLVFKEAVNNVAKHSRCSHAFSSLSMKDHALIVEVDDNGQGFDVSLPSHRNGIKNMQSRMKKWKGVIYIESVIGGGTKIHLRMPITQKGD